MGYQGNERGARNPLSRRVGRDFEAFGGEVSEFDPATVGLGDFVSAVNADVNPERVTPRPGEAKVLLWPLEASVKGIWDLESYLGEAAGPTPTPAPTDLLIVHTADFSNGLTIDSSTPNNIYVTDGAALATIVGTTAPPYVSNCYWSAQNKIAWGTCFTLGGSAEIRTYAAGPPGLAEPTNLATVTDSSGSGTTVDYGITGMCEGPDGLLYFGVRFPSGATTKIYTCDGDGNVTMVKDTLLTAGVYLTKFSAAAGDWVVATFEGIAPVLLWESFTAGVPSGTWTSNGITGFASISRHRGAAHVMSLGGDNVLCLAYTWPDIPGAERLGIGIMWPDPATTWATHSLTGSTLANSGCGGLVGLNETLYIFFNATHVGDRWVTTFDQVNNWVNEAFPLTDMGVTSVEQACVLGDEAQVVLAVSGSISGGIFASDGADITLPFTNLSPGLGGNFNPVICVGPAVAP